MITMTLYRADDNGFKTAYRNAAEQANETKTPRFVFQDPPGPIHIATTRPASGIHCRIICPDRAASVAKLGNLAAAAN